MTGETSIDCGGVFPTEFFTLEVSKGWCPTELFKWQFSKPPWGGEGRVLDPLTNPPEFFLGGWGQESGLRHAEGFFSFADGWFLCTHSNSDVTPNTEHNKDVIRCLPPLEFFPGTFSPLSYFFQFPPPTPLPPSSPGCHPPPSCSICHIFWWKPRSPFAAQENKPSVWDAVTFPFFSVNLTVNT